MDKHQARLREALAGPPTEKSKGPPVADGTLTVTPDTPEAVEWRTRRSVIDGPTSSSYLEDDSGPQPHELYAKYTWKIENFKDVQKRELRSTVFRVGDFKWYVLVYPQGCDVCNHLSLFLCVADYDKLLPGWAHFAQFTIAVVNKDAKKSKYSDTLHRFCKKEHDWGWKKFMEISKVFEGFTVSDTLVIKAQVQVIRDRPNAPFRCLDPQYRRELVRVYLTNVETICRKFVDEKREWLCRLRDAPGFRTYWESLPRQRKRALQMDRGQDVLKGLVKRFFNEKEVTSTLVMDALFSGCKQLEEASSHLLEAARPGKNGARSGEDSLGGIIVNAEKNTFGIAGNALALLEKAATETIPPFRDDKVAEGHGIRNAQDGEDYSKDYVERDERRLADLGRRAVEMYIISQIFSELETAHNEAESIKRQDELIAAEELAASQARDLHEKKAATDREKKARKKERRRQKKEAEEKEKEAKDAERKALEDARRLEQERKAVEAAERRRREEEQREKDREVALREAAATYRAREATRIQQAVSRVESAPVLRTEPKTLVAHPVPTGSVSDDGSESSGRGGEAEACGRQGQPGEDSKPGTSAPGRDGDGSTTFAASLSSEDAFSDAFNSSSSTQSDEELVVSLREQLEATKKELAAAEAAAAQAPALEVAVATLQERVRILEAELAIRCAALAQAQAALADARKSLAEREAEASSLRAQAAAAVVAVRSTPAPSPPLASAPSLTGSASTTTVADLASTVSEASLDSQPSSPPASPHGSTISSTQSRKGLAVQEGGDVPAVRQSTGTVPGTDSGPRPLENGMAHPAGPGTGNHGQAPQALQGRGPRSAWNGVLQQSNGPVGPHHNPPGAHAAGPRGRQGKEKGAGGAEAPPASDANNHRGTAPAAKTLPAPQITDRELKEATAAAQRALRPQGHSNSVAEPVAQPSPSQRPSGGPAGKPYNAGPRVGLKGAHAAAMSKTLNGSAAPFIPSSMTSASPGAPANVPPPPPPTANGIGPHPTGSGQVPKSIPSYRNAAAGTIPPGAAPPAPAARPAVGGPSGPPTSQPAPPTPPVPGPKQAPINGMTSPPPPRVTPEASGGPTRTPAVSPITASMMGMPPRGDNGFRPAMYRPGGMTFQTPMHAKRPGDGVGPHDTPGGVTNLDDFAHLHLITDLLTD